MIHCCSVVDAASPPVAMAIDIIATLLQLGHGVFWLGPEPCDVNPCSPEGLSVRCRLDIFAAMFCGARVRAVGRVRWRIHVCACKRLCLCELRGSCMLVFFACEFACVVACVLECVFRVFLSACVSSWGCVCERWRVCVCVCACVYACLCVCVCVCLYWFVLV